MPHGATQRWVIHADLDAFFAAAEVLRRPELAGRPLIVGGAPGGRGVVAAASYEARVFGVRSAMPVATALRLCPQAICVRPDGDYYRTLSRRFRAILDDFSPLVEVVSVDEAYLDASGSERLSGGAVALGQALKERVRQETGLIVSLGVAGNRLVAKLASELGKPDGFTVIPPGRETATLAPLPVERLPGIGPKSGLLLRGYGITTLGELAKAPEALLRLVAGRHAETLRRRALGQDDRPVRGERDPQKSIGHERTFQRDLVGIDALRAPLYRLAEATGAELRRRGLVAGSVAIKLRYGDFETLTRQRALPEPTDAHQRLFDAALHLTEQTLAQRHAPVRLIGVRAAGLTPFAMQLELLDNERARVRSINRALDELAERHGRGIVAPAWTNTSRAAGAERRVS
jgi:DNA polymerase-4